MLKVIKTKIYPTRTQNLRLASFIDRSRKCFNQALEQRIHACRANGKAINYYEQQKQLSLQRKVDPVIRGIPCDIERDGLRRIDTAFKNFFRRCKEGAKKKGFPRFKSANRYNSFTIDSCGPVIRDGRIHVRGIKKPIRCRGLQPSPAIPRRLTIVRRGRSWFARILIDDGQVIPPKKSPDKAVGIDVGLNSFITTSDGEKVDCPKHYRRLSRKLRRAQKRLSRCVRGSNRRKRAILAVQSVHAKIADCRDDFTHQLSRKIVNQYDFIAVEDLKISNMVRNRSLSKSILDAAWGQFIYRLGYKAEKAGATVVKVNPSGTSQECSRCGTTVHKELSERVHDCKCGLVLDRDVNAARNILQRARSASLSGNDGVTDAEDQPLLMPVMV